MARALDERDEAPLSSNDLDAATESTAVTGAAPRVLIIDADSALFELITEWLAAQRCGVVAGQSHATHPAEKFDAVIVDMPFPRQRGAEVLARVREAHRGTPIIVLSAHFFAGIESAGAVARTLGVARVLPKPVTREALSAAVHGVLEHAT
jgi:two-component system response regulator CiaR